MTSRPKIMLDSGAFSARTLGVHIDLSEYTRYVKENATYIDNYVNLDVIPDGHREELIEQGAAASYRNQQTMKDAGLSPIPVFHEGERFDWLERYLANDEHYVAVAPAKGRDPRQWLDDVFHRLSDGNGRPLVKVHGLGITRPTLLRRYRWTSVDSATWLKQSRVGHIPVPLYQYGKPDFSFGPTTFVITDRSRGRPCHIDTADDFDLDRINRFVNEEVGIDIAEARYSYEYRYKVWIAYLKALESHCAVPIYFVTNTNRREYVLLNDAHVEHRLLSYARLNENSLEEYIAGDFGPASPTRKQVV
jgi:hypothetical protein